MMQGERCPRLSAAVLAIAAMGLIAAPRPAMAVEGASAAGPIGGTDMRSALLPPPGLYGGVAGLFTHVRELHDGSGRPIPALNAVNINPRVGGPFVLYVPDVHPFGGSLGLFGVYPMGQVCGQLTSAVPYHCINGFGDPYVEMTWSRSFGQLRPPRDAGAFPIMQGLAVALGLGMVIPIGRYDAQGQRTNSATIGSNTFDVAPTFAMTYTTPPLLADGTEFSTKLFWNNYGTNPETQYKAGSLIDIDFAITEHIGRFQVGVAGFHAFQIEDDNRSGVRVPPDGKRLNSLALGAVVNCDLAEIGAVIRVKYLQTVESRNGIMSRGFVVTFGKKLF